MLSLGKRFPLSLLCELFISYTKCLPESWFWPQGMLSWVSPSPGATFALLLLHPRWCHIRQQQLQQLWLTIGRRHGEWWRGRSSFRCFLMAMPKKYCSSSCPSAQPSYRFELVIWSVVSSLGLQSGSVWEHCMGVHRVQFLSVCTTWCKHKMDICVWEHSLPCICSWGIQRRLPLWWREQHLGNCAPWEL